MVASSTQPNRRRRCGRISVRALSVLACLLVGAWLLRLPALAFVARKVLEQQGWPDTDFRLSRLSPGCLVVDRLTVGGADPVLSADSLEARFSLSELRRGQLSRLRVRGLRVPAVIEADRLSFPLQQRLASALSARAARVAAASQPDSEVGMPLSFGELSVFDVQVPVSLKGGAEWVTLRGDAGLVAEPGERGAGAGSGRYRAWADLRAPSGFQGTLSGSVSPGTGALVLSGDVKVKNVEGLVEHARLAAPDWASRLPAVPTNCSFAARGSVALSGWTNAGPFEVTAELGRGSALALKRPDGLVRFQTLRVEASGTPQDIQCRLSVGVGGFRVGGRIQASQEEGRLLSMRGTARLRQTSTNRVLRATLDSDLPGKSVAQVLPNVLPLLPRLLTEGGTFHAEADLEQPPEGSWQGNVRYTAEARRNSLTLPAGRVGAGRVAIGGALLVRNAAPGEWTTDIRVEDGYFFRPGLSVRGGGVMSLCAQPPYRTASGTFEGKVNETAALPASGAELPDDGVRLEGFASVDGLVSNPVWQVDLRVPEFPAASRRESVACRATAGAAARILYSATRFSADGEAWAREAAVTVASTGQAGRVEAGLGRLAARFSVENANPSALSNALVRVTLEASNGWFRADERAALESASARVPLVWSQARGVSFGPGPSLTWSRLEAAGVRLLPGELTLREQGSRAEAAFSVRAEGSRFGATARAQVPMNAPGQCVIDVTVPEAELAADDTLAAPIRRADPAAVVTGRLGAEARLRFLGTQPHALGRVRVTGAKVCRDRLEIGGLSADVAFEAGLGFRTIERPAVTFDYAKAGNIRLDKGRAEFQVTPEEVFVDRFEVGWCKGNLNAYSVHLDPRNPHANVIVYADRIDLGEALMMVMPFKGKMEGVLYGRFPVGIEGSRVKLSTGYLYSLPGQGGVLRLEDSAQMRSLLDRAGILGDVQQPLSQALSDMDFSTIRMELEPKAEGDAVFRIKLDGKSNFKEWPAPVALNLNLHGPLEELLNLGLSVSRK